MKLNYRDKIILGVLLAVVILLLGFFLLIKPKKADIESDKATLTQVQQQKDEIDAKIAEIKPLQKQIKETYDNTTKLTGDFVAYNDINNPRKIDQYMQHFCEDCEVKITNLSTDNISETTLDYYYFEPSMPGEGQLEQADLNGDRKAALDEEKAESSSLKERTKESVLAGQYTISVKGSKENFWKYMQALEEQDKTIIINSISINGVYLKETAEVAEALAAMEADGREPTAEINISLYSVYELSEPNVEAD